LVRLKWMTPHKATRHDSTKPRGKREPASCKVQTAATLRWVEDGQPMFWTDRPLKFPGALASRIAFFKRNGRNVTMTDIKWKQLGSETWWRIPEWPDGTVTT